MTYIITQMEYIINEIELQSFLRQKLNHVDRSLEKFSRK